MLECCFMTRFFFIRLQSGTAMARQSILMKERHDMSSSFSIPKDIALSVRDTVVLSEQSNHPAYLVNTANAGERLTEILEKEKRNKQITVLVICSENGSVTLSNLEVSFWYLKFLSYYL